MTVRRHLDLPFGTDADDVQPDLLFRVAETTAISAPGMSGLAYVRPNNVKSGLQRLRSRVDRSKNWPDQPATAGGGS